MSLSTTPNAKMTIEQALLYHSIYKQQVENLNYKKAERKKNSMKAMIIVFIVVFICVGALLAVLIYESNKPKPAPVVIPEGLSFKNVQAMAEESFAIEQAAKSLEVISMSVYFQCLLLFGFFAILIPCMLGLYALPAVEKPFLKVKADILKSYNDNKMDEVLLLIPELKPNNSGTSFEDKYVTYFTYKNPSLLFL